MFKNALVLPARVMYPLVDIGEDLYLPATEYQWLADSKWSRFYTAYGELIVTLSFKVKCLFKSGIKFELQGLMPF